jgi:glutamate racemase
MEPSLAEKPIGIFDSGIGGLTVLHKAIRELPHENFIYYADTAHVPYGTKSKEDVRKYILEAVAFLDTIGMKALVLACNTATSIAVNELRSKYSFPVLGMEPAVKPAVERTNGKRVLVLATQLTLQEQKFKDLVERVSPDKSGEKIVCLAMPELVDFAERFIFEEETVLPVLKNKLSHLSLESYGTVVLGCTHFPFFKKTISKLFPSLTDIIDGNDGTVRHLKNSLESGNLLNAKTEQGHVQYYDSGKAVSEVRFKKYLDNLQVLAV